MNFYAPPNLVNQPPQIFGNFAANGSQMSGSLPDAMFVEDNTPGLDDAIDHGDPKRRRIARVRCGSIGKIRRGWTDEGRRPAICVGRRR